MENILSIMIVEDDSDACARLESAAAQVGGIRVIGSTGSSTHALELMRADMPDALILDLELHFGSGSGLGLLESLRSISPERAPFVLVTTHNSSRITYERARQLGADYIMYKHQQDYSETGVMEFLLSMSGVIKGREATAPQRTERADKPTDRLTAVYAMLDRIGISPKAVGYKYLADAILLTAHGKTHNISTAIGDKYGKTESSVERAMQNAINRAWKTSELDTLLNFYTAHINSLKGVPTVTEFIHYFANKLELE